jgi:D-amino-acid dehydrogenase
MNAETDVLIVGGGVIGVCCARALAEAGREVTLLEKGEIASGCSEANAGLIAASQCVPLAAPGVIAKALRWMLQPESPFYLRPRLDPGLLRWLWRFRAACREDRMRRGLAVLRDLTAASQHHIEELAAREELDLTYRRHGLLKPWATEKGFQEGMAEARLLQEFGIEAQVLDAAEAQARLPAGAPAVAGAVFFPGDGHVVPAAFVRALASAAQAAGARLLTGTEAVGFETDGRRITGVRTSRGEFGAEHVVLAAGAGSHRLGRMLGLRLPLQPAKGYSVTVPVEGEPPSAPLLLGEAKVAVTPLGGAVRFSGTLEFAGMDLAVNERRLGAVRRAGARFCPVAGAIGEAWAGLRPCTPDGLPLIGRTRRWENLLIAAGHATKGMCLGPLTGRLIAQHVIGEEPDMDLAPLSPDRWARD